MRLWCPLASRFTAERSCDRPRHRAAFSASLDWRSDAIPKGKGIQRITFAVSAGSILGATLGGLAVAYAPVQFPKLLLGCVLIAAAGKTVIRAD